jgi:hypothetical protein
LVELPRNRLASGVGFHSTQQTIDKKQIGTDPLAAARLRGLEAKKQLAAMEGGLISADLMAKRLRVTLQAVERKRRSGKILAVPAEDSKDYLYPAWQSEVGNVPAILAVLKGRNEWEQLGFFVSPNERLTGKTPLEALRRKRVRTVIEAALSYGEHGAA